MFRQEETFIGGWQDKTIDAMQKRRFDTITARLGPLAAQRMEALPPAVFSRRIERSWQEIKRKPLRSQQLSHVRSHVLSCVAQHADCLSREEHQLVERALILGGSAQLTDAFEIEAAQALSLRLWANVGLIGGRPYIELEPELLRPIARAIAREEHEQIRLRFEAFSAQLSALLYRAGALDDRLPQQMIVSDVLGKSGGEDEAMMLARRYLWSGCDCVDYGGGVMLLHPALAEPSLLLPGRRCVREQRALLQSGACCAGDILPEEIPLQEALERHIDGALRAGLSARDVARDIRFLCKQGAPLGALQEVLQSSLIVLVSGAMRGALKDMYYMTPKWIECADRAALQ